MNEWRVPKSVVDVAVRCAALACVLVPVVSVVSIVSAICADVPAAWSKSASDGKPSDNAKSDNAKSDNAKSDSSKPVNYFSMGKSSTPPHRSSATRASVTIVGTDCYTCVERMKRKFKRVPGVKKVYIMCWEPYEAFVNFDSTKTSWSQIAQAIADEKAQLVNVKIEPLLPKAKTK